MFQFSSLRRRVLFKVKKIVTNLIILKKNYNKIDYNAVQKESHPKKATKEQKRQPS